MELDDHRIKPIVIDCRNSLFANTPAGAESSVVAFSMIETAKESGLDPFRYLAYVFHTAPNLNPKCEDWVLPLLSENAPESCHV